MAIKKVRAILNKPISKLSTAFFIGLLTYNISTTDIRAAGNLTTSPAKNSNKEISVEPYVKLGSIEWTEKGISEGHKFTVTPGISISSLKGPIRINGNAELYFMGEALDEDTEIPDKGYHLNANITFHPSEKKDNDFYFILGANLDGLRRESNEKYPGSFKRLDYLTPEAGLGIKHKNIETKLKVNYPLWSDTDVGRNDGKPGIEASVDYSWKRLKLTAFYKKNAFKGTPNQPEFDVQFTGIKAGFEF